MTREEVIDLMRDHIRVEPVLPELETGGRSAAPGASRSTPSGSTSAATTPEVAAAVANRLANDFIDEHIKERVAGLAATPRSSSRPSWSGCAAQIREVEAQIAQVKDAERRAACPRTSTPTSASSSARSTSLRARAARPRARRERRGLLPAAGDRRRATAAARSGRSADHAAERKQRLRARRSASCASRGLHRQAPGRDRDARGSEMEVRLERDRPRRGRRGRRGRHLRAAERARPRRSAPSCARESAQQRDRRGCRRRSNEIAGAPGAARRAWPSSSTRSSASTSTSFAELPGVQQQAPRGGRGRQHGAAPEGRAVPHARGGLPAAGADLAEPTR